MSTNDTADTDSNGSNGARDDYARRSLDEKRKAIERQKQLEQLEESTKAESGRKVVAAEEESGAPADSLEALLNTEEVEFRGVPFTFAEPGDVVLEAQEYSDGEVDQGTDAAQFVYETLGKKSVDKDEEFWRNFDLGQEGGDGIMDLFNRYVEAFSEIPDDEREQIEDFQPQNTD